MLIIFDFDGTLVELEEMQNSAYDAVFKEYGINFDIRTIKPGVPITEKMAMLKDMGYEFDEEEFKMSRDLWVLDNVDKYLKFSEELYCVLQTLCSNHVLCIATNGARPYVERATEILNIKSFISKINTIDEFNPKPDPSMFLDCIATFPQSTVIFEDSPSGITAAAQTDATLEVVTGLQDTINKLKQRYDI